LGDWAIGAIGRLGDWAIGAIGAIGWKKLNNNCVTSIIQYCSFDLIKICFDEYQ